MLFALATAIRVQAAGDPASEVTLTKAAQIRALTPAQARQHPPARLCGIVISEAESDGDGIVLLDDTAGIYVSGPFTTLRQLHRGDLVVVSGACDPGEFAPILLFKEAQQLGRKPVPEPRPATYEQMISGSLDSQWVEVAGIVRHGEMSTARPRRWGFDLATGGGRLQVAVTTTNSLGSLVDAEVRIRGICFYEFNQNRQLIRPELFVPYDNLIQVEIPAHNDPLAIPVCPIGSLFQFSPTGTFGHWRHLHGVVTASERGRQFWIQDGDSGIRVLTRQTNTLTLGDVVDVLGFPIRGGYSPVLEDAIYRKTGAVPAPAPLCLTTPAAALSYDARLVQLEGLLTDVKPSLDGYILKLTTDGEPFTAVLSGREIPLMVPDSWQVGSRMRLTGICSVTVNTIGSPASGITRPDGFQLLLHSANAVVIVQPAAWLSWERGVWLLAATSVALIASVMAVSMLARRRLREQTTQRELAERELTAILNERNRMAREIHDTLAQGLGAISIQLELVRENLGEGNHGALVHLGQARKLVRASLADARSAIWNMRVQVLEQGNLAEALAGVLQQMSGGAGVKYEFHPSGEVRRLAPLAENALLRLGQEAITNAIRHGKPKLVRVELEFGAKLVKLVVHDDGIGFNVAQPPPSASGFGLLGMRERAEHLGGTCTLHSEPGRGTDVLIEVPIPA
jgi:signal transduction histidine kinase